MRGLRLAAVAVALLLGAIAGLATAELTRDDGPGSASDPLSLGISMVDQSCTGKSILLLGRGDTRAALRTAIVNSVGGDQAHYLEVRRSCPTYYTSAETGTPDYAVYLGPYDSATAACRVRMSVDHLGDTVTRLALGNESYVKCPCELSTSSMPTLAPGMTATPLDTMWVKQLQGMLVDIHRLRDDVDETGVYDRRTVSRIRKIQAFYGQPVTGVVDPTTWGLLTNRACQHYDY